MKDNQISLEELKSWFSDVWNIIVDIHISINNMERLWVDKYEYEEQIKRHGFFQHHWYQLKFISIIQFYKLIKDTEERSFTKVCNKLINNKYTPDLKNHLNILSNTSTLVCKDRAELKSFASQLKSSFDDKAELISKVIELRNNIYAHKGTDNQVKAVTLDELKELCDFLTNAFNDFWLKTFFQQAYITAEDWNINYVLFHCNESMEWDEKERIRKITKT
ncbi:hypothetical protein [Pontibacter anaerobius]|uniref:HEPN AbiU2-like domain-containing protein n=1 Tax=Pontibacter anaerobius TaxID=2993940 RepID=A0ABT3RKY4_9BACT|nr:hypothetical protein [Pontibacter anaerobius]MCX2742158.1 hypothetical protein [Pontibacter anaerobius]